MAKKYCSYESAVAPYCPKNPDFNPSIATIAAAIESGNQEVQNLLNLLNLPLNQSELNLPICNLCAMIATRQPRKGLCNGTPTFFGVHSARPGKSKK